MSREFYGNPILNSPYEYPRRHWKLDDSRLPTSQVVPSRRKAEFISPVPAPTTARRLALGEKGLSTAEQQYDTYSVINQIRSEVDRWRGLPERQWGVTPETARLLRHWREHKFRNIRPFFCQVEAAETAIWLVEVAGVLSPPHVRIPARFREIRNHLWNASRGANPDLLRIALKMATGSGKTMVMAMLIAWQTVNAVRHPLRHKFTRGFLVVTPGITIRERLRVLRPNDPDSYYRRRELVPRDMRPDLGRAQVVITNFHAFRRRERLKLAKGTRALLHGRDAAPGNTVETEGEMIRRVMAELMGLKRILVLNDEGHHCYREKLGRPDEAKLKGDDLTDAKADKEAARVWISGIETVKETLPIPVVLDFSATPFFLRGSGYAEGTLFPWTVSDFSLMDAIECGIVKLPRVPVSDDATKSTEMPTLRDLWRHIGKKMPKRAPGKGKPPLDPRTLPPLFENAFSALYSHYRRTFEAWRDAGIRRPPVFIVVCSNTAASKLVHDYIAGYEFEDDGERKLRPSQFRLLANYDEAGRRRTRPRTLLIDSRQLEAEDALGAAFRRAAKNEIEQFRQEKAARPGGDGTKEITDAELLREAMNTVGQPDRLGGKVRCVVSVSMLTEGWDANTVTHILGARAFSTQLLCEQVVGRALRRESYELNDNGHFDPEYADVLGVPFDFTAKPVVVPPVQPKPVELVKALPEREDLEIRFPNVEGYRVELPDDRLTASFSKDSTLVLTQELVGPWLTTNRGIAGLPSQLSPDLNEGVRTATLAYHLTRDLLRRHLRDRDGEERLHLFGQVKRIVRIWLEDHLECREGTHPGQLLYQGIAAVACERIDDAITLGSSTGESRPLGIPSPYDPVGTTEDVHFHTSKTTLHKTTKSHVNLAVCDSGWEKGFCRMLEMEPRVHAYVKNAGLGFEVPYRFGRESHRYLPDFIVRVASRGSEPLHLVVEIKGQPDNRTKAKAETMRTRWVPGVNNLGSHGVWDFVELRSLETMGGDFRAFLDRRIGGGPT